MSLQFLEHSNPFPVPTRIDVQLVEFYREIMAKINKDTFKYASIIWILTELIHDPSTKKI